MSYISFFPTKGARRLLLKGSRFHHPCPLRHVQSCDEEEEEEEEKEPPPPPPPPPRPPPPPPTATTTTTTTTNKPFQLSGLAISHPIGCGLQGRTLPTIWQNFQLSELSSCADSKNFRRRFPSHTKKNSDSHYPVLLKVNGWKSQRSDCATSVWFSLVLWQYLANLHRLLPLPESPIAGHLVSWGWAKNYRRNTRISHGQPSRSI